MTGIDLTTAEGAETWILELKRRAVAEFRKFGRIPTPLMVLLATRDQDTGKALDTPCEMILFLSKELMGPEPESKNRLGLWIRRLAGLTDAIGFAYGMETWVLEADITPSGSWENVPGRKEAITVIVEHRALGTKTRNYSRRILRPSSSKVQLGPWELNQANGRFASVLRTPAAEAHAATLVAGALAASVDWTPGERRAAVERIRERLRAEGKMSQAMIDKSLLAFIGRMREAGQEVAPRPEDVARAGGAANEQGPPIGVMDISEWVK